MCRFALDAADTRVADNDTVSVAERHQRGPDCPMTFRQICGPEPVTGCCQTGMLGLAVSAVVDGSPTAEMMVGVAPELVDLCVLAVVVREFGYFQVWLVHWGWCRQVIGCS
jgi:hypothetical protein